MYEYFTITSAHAECTWRLYKLENQLKETEKTKIYPVYYRCK